MEFAERIFTAADGLRLYARDYPGIRAAGRAPVVCLHGLTRNSRDFEDLAPRIAAGGRRVLVPDTRGRGRSAYDPQPLNYTPQTYVDDVLALLAEADEPRAVFIGTSMGGVVTMLLAMSAPEAVAGALLNDVGPEVAPEGLARILSGVNAPAVLRTWDEAVDFAQSSNGVAFPAYGRTAWETFARRLFRKDGDQWALDYDPQIMAPFRAPAPEAPPADPPADPPFDPWSLFAHLAAERPVAVVRGETSDVLAPQTLARMRQIAPHMDVTEVKGVGHAPNLDEPTAFAAVSRFLDRCP